jgi:hypothetical protein
MSKDSSLGKVCHLTYLAVLTEPPPIDLRCNILLQLLFLGILHPHLGRIAAGTASTHTNSINPRLKADTKIGFHTEAPFEPDPYSSSHPSARAAITTLVLVWESLGVGPRGI